MRAQLSLRGIRGEVHDSYRYAASLFSKVVSDGYIGMVRTIPSLYGLIYDRAERAPAAGGFRKWAAEFTARNIMGLMRRLQPSVVVCTHAFPAGVMAAYKRLYDSAIPVMAVVTDFAVHPFWIYKNIDAYAVATPEVRSALIARGIEAARIGIDGIPVDRRFGALPDDRAALRAELGLDGDRAVVLVMGGGLGLGPVAATVGALAQMSPAVTPVVIVGKNRRLEARLLEEARRSGGDARVCGFVENVFDWMHAADVLVTKPGGLTTSEALAARVPLVLLRPLPGQEERNARFLSTRGAAVLATRGRDVDSAVGSVLGDALLANRLRDGAAALAHPDASERIAARIAAMAQTAGR